LALNVAWLLATQPELEPGQADRALALAERFVTQAGRTDAQSLNILAAAYAASGRFELATRTAHDARQAALRRGERGLADFIESLLVGYARGEPVFPSRPDQGR